MKKKISIVIPFYNEAGNLALLYKRLLKNTEKLDFSFEYIFVDDGSKDDSCKIIEKLASENKNIRLIQFSRNFGKETATTAGINSTDADACIIMDADLQHPPELIPKLVKKWSDGAKAVVGVRKRSKDESFTKIFGSKVFYWIMNKIGEIDFVPNSTDFRLIDKQIVIEFNRLSERNRIARGLIGWLGFSQEYVYFTAPNRKTGKPSYGFLKLARLAMNSFVSLSLFPLKLAGYLGIFIMLISGTLGLFILVNQFILQSPIPLVFSGTAMLAILIIFLVGLILICIGLLALYVANIHSEVLSRPLYIIKRQIN